MEWTRDKCLQLIHEYENNPLLWNPAHGLYYNKTKKHETWVIIDKIMGCPWGDSKKKIENILSSFRREKIKGKDKTYVSKWYAFPHLAFLLDKDESISKIDFIKEEALSDDEYVNAFKEETDADYLQNTELRAESPQGHVANEPSAVYLQNTELRSESPQTHEASKSSTEYQLKKRKRLPLPPEEHPKIGEAFKILKSAVTNYSLKFDECSVYGQHVANKLRSYNKKAKNIVQHRINMILFNADMGQYDDGKTTPSP